MAFHPRRGQYIKQKRGRYYYRRAIPEAARQLFDGKREWVIALQGQSDAERAAEAQAIADRHNRMMRMAQSVDVEEAAKLAAEAAVMRIDLSRATYHPEHPPPPLHASCAKVRL